MSLTNNPKNQNIQVSLKISGLKGESVLTEIIGYTLLPTFVKRLVRKDKTRIDDSFIVKTNDNKNLKVKMFFLTLNKTSKSVATALRKACQESLKNKVSKMDSGSFFNDVTSHKLQSILRKELGKVYPLKQCEVRDMNIIEEKKEEDSKKTKPVEKKTETKKTETKEDKKEEKPKAEEKKVEPKEEKPKKEEKKEDAKTDN